MDAFRRMAIYSTIWTLILLRTNVESVRIGSPREVFHLAHKTYTYESSTMLQIKDGIPEEISRARSRGMEQDANIIKEDNKPLKHDDVFQTIKKSLRQADSGVNRMALRQAVSGVKRVAFFAVISTDVIGLGNGQTIPFVTTNINEGDAFDTLFHAFVCPVHGIFLFRSSLMSEKNSHIETEVVRDGIPVFRMYASGVNLFDQGFKSGIIDCKKGQRIWVRVNGNLGTDVRPLLYTTFSGYLLWEIDAPRSVVNTRANSTDVAFHSYLSTTIDSLQNQQTIPFEQVILNEGQCYNNKSYIFSCPVTGVYMFQSSVFSNFGPIEIELVKDGIPFVRMYASASGMSNSQHDQGFNAGIILCSKDQKVWVRVHQGTSVMKYQFTTFSGYLLWEMEDASTIPEITGRAVTAGHTHVAFHSYLSAAVATLGREQTIPFDRTLLNEGNGFNPGLHTFICPVNGLYVFQSAIMVTHGETATEIVKDSSPFARMYSGANNGGQFDQGYDSGIINCYINERVWVRASDQSGAGTVYNYNWTTFSGFLLWEI